MAKSEIARKLSLELQKGDAFTEPRVVYVLVQARKLLETMNNRDFETLKFYCDWVLHVKLDRNKGASNVIKLFESIQKAADEGNAELYESRSMWLFEQVLSADTFRNQLIDVLSRGMGFVPKFSQTMPTGTNFCITTERSSRVCRLK